MLPSQVSPQCCCPSPQYPTPSCSTHGSGELSVEWPQGLGSPLGAGGLGQGPTEGLLWWHLSLCTKPHLLDLDPRAEELLGPQSRGTLFHVGRGWFGLSTFPTASAAPPVVWIPSAEECLLPALPSPQPGYHRAAQGWEGTAAPHIVTSLAHLFPAKMKT